MDEKKKSIELESERYPLNKAFCIRLWSLWFCLSYMNMVTENVLLYDDDEYSAECDAYIRIRIWSNTVKPVYNDHLIGYFFAFWSSSRWPMAS